MKAFPLLKGLRALMRSEPHASSCQPLDGCRSPFLRKISARVKLAVEGEMMDPAEVQARAADEGSMVEVGRFDADGEILQLMPLTIDQARELAREIWARIKLATGGSMVEVVPFNADGAILRVRPLTIDQARKFVRDLEESIAEVVARNPEDALNTGPSR